MAVKQASAWGTAWQSGVSGASQKYTDGINATTVDVVGKAIAAKAALVANFNAVVASGEWERRLGAVGTTGWKSASIAKAANYVTGATAGLSRYQNFAQQAQPFWTNLQATVDGMPSGSLADSLQRVSAWMQGMQQFAQGYTP
jgi:hypothetical protein